jgi:hypothetical protein
MHTTRAAAAVNEPGVAGVHCAAMHAARPLPLDNILQLKKQQGALCHTVSGIVRSAVWVWLAQGQILQCRSGTSVAAAGPLHSMLT